MDGGALARVEAMLASLDPWSWSRAGTRRRARRSVAARPSGARPQGRPVVLVEHPDGAVRAVAARVLAEAGYAVETCGGPEHLTRGRCPLVDGHECPLAASADVVVHGLGLGRADGRSVLRAMRERHPWTPVVIDAPAPQLAEHEELVDDAAVLRSPWARVDLLEAVRAQLDEHADRR